MPIFSKSLQINFNGYSKKINNNSDILFKFFTNKYSVLNEIKENNFNNKKDNDYIFKYFFYNLAKVIVKDNEDNILARKIKSIEQSVKSRK